MSILCYPRSVHLFFGGGIICDKVVGKSCIRSILNFFPSTHSVPLLVKCSTPKFKHVVNSTDLFRRSQCSPPKTNEYFELLPSRLLPGAAVSVSATLPWQQVNNEVSAQTSCCLLGCDFQANQLAFS